MSDAIAKTNVVVGASTGGAVTGFDKLLASLKATERQIKQLQTAGKQDGLVDSTRDLITSARVLPRSFADATREVQKLITATRQRNALEKEGQALANRHPFTSRPAPGFTDRVARMARPTGGGAGAAVAGAVAGLTMKAADLALAAATAPFDFIKESVSRAADAERTAAAFDVLTGSAAKATQVLAGLRQYAADSPLGTASILDAARNLAAVGVEADQLVPSLRMLGDISGGDAERLRGVSKAYGDVLTSGRLAGQELIQFANAGVPLLDELAKQAGKPKAMMKPLIERGEIGSAADVVRAMKAMTQEGGRFFGMSDKYAQTFAGGIERLKDGWEGLQREFGTAVVEEFGLKKLTGGAADRLDAIKKGVDSLRPGLRLAGDLFRGLTNAAGQFAAIQQGVTAGGFGALAAAANLSGFAADIRAVSKAMESWKADPTAVGLAVYDAVGAATVGVAGLVDELEQGAEAFEKNWLKPARELGKELAFVGRMMRAVTNPASAFTELAVATAGLMPQLDQARQAVGLTPFGRAARDLGLDLAPTPASPKPDPNRIPSVSMLGLSEAMARDPGAQARWANAAAPPPPLVPTRASRTIDRLAAGRADVSARLGFVQSVINSTTTPGLANPNARLPVDAADPRNDPFAALAGGLGAVRRQADQTGDALRGLAGGVAGFGLRAEGVRVPDGLPGNLAAEAAQLTDRYALPFAKLSRFDKELGMMQAAGAITGDVRARAFKDRVAELGGDRLGELRLTPAAELGTREYARLEASLAGGNEQADLAGLFKQSVALNQQEVTLGERLLRTMEAVLKAVNTPQKIDGTD